MDKNLVSKNRGTLPLITSLCQKRNTDGIQQYSALHCVVKMVFLSHKGYFAYPKSNLLRVHIDKTVMFTA